MAVLLIRQKLAEHIFDDGHNGQALGSLGAPAGIDLAGMAAPQVLRVVFKKHGVELAAETVDVEILQGVFFSLKNRCFQVAETCHDGGGQSHIFEGLPFQGNRIVEKLFIKINTGHAVSRQHDPVFLLRIRAARSRLHGTLQINVVPGRCSLLRQHLCPPLVDLRHFGEETVAAHVHAVAFIADGLGDATHVLALLQYGDVHLV